MVQVKRYCKVIEVAEVPQQTYERLQLVATDLLNHDILSGYITDEDDLDACREDMMADLIYEWADDTGEFAVVEQVIKDVQIDGLR